MVFEVGVVGNGAGNVRMLNSLDKHFDNSIMFQLTQSLYSIAIPSSRRLHMRPLVMKLRTSRFGIHTLNFALSDELDGPLGILSELSSINFLRLARCLFKGPR